MAISGHEEEFRALFAEEADQRLADLTRDLLALEEAGTDEELVASVFREAHTLKGAAGVVGLEEVALVAHAMESLLEQLRSGSRLATPDLIDGVLAAVDGIKEMLPAVLAGEDRLAAARSIEESLHALAEGGSVSADAALSSGAEPTADQTAPRPSEPTPAVADVAAPNNGDAGELVAAPRHHAPSDAEVVRVPLARLDELVRLVGESATANLRFGRLISERLGVDPATIDEMRDLSRVLNELQERTMRVRMVPVSTITDGLQKAVRDVARSTGKSVRWEVRGEDTELDRGVLQQLTDPLLHLVRNAVDHGIETAAEREAAGKPEQATVRLHAMQLGSEVIVTITDDGKGIEVERVRSEAKLRGTDTSGLTDEEALYLIFRSGLSTASFVSDISGRGVGLDVVRTNVEAVRGRVEIHSEPGVGSEFRLIVPITLAVLPCLMVEAGAMRHAIPMHSVVQAQAQAAETSAEGKAAVWIGSQAVPLSNLAGTLGLPPDESGPIVVVAGLTRRHAFRVGGLVGQRDVAVKGLSRLLPRLDVLAGASVEPDGSILLVLDVPGVIDRARSERGTIRVPAAPQEPSQVTTSSGATRGKLLVVDDALTVRELQRSILARAGYEVLTAVDGVEAMATLAEGPVDLVLTDVEMPRMDGFALTEAIRAHPARSNVPVLILTSRASEEDRQRGMEAGADGYIVKSAFDETALLAAPSIGSWDVGKPMPVIKVVVVEDSTVQRKHLVKALEADGDISVVGEAADAREAIELVRALEPDVVSVDLGIPGGGIHAIEQIMAFSPTPIVVLSASVADRESEAAVEALLAGAVDALPKPMAWNAESERTLRGRVRVLRGVRVLRHPRGRLEAGRLARRSRSAEPRTATPMVAIGASTGGPAALATLLAGLSGLEAAVLIVQHLHPGFIDGFVSWMQRVSGLPVEVATDGTALQPGLAYVGPGDVHLKVGRDDRIVLDPEPETLHRPSVNALFTSVAERPDRRRVGVLLTGMGDDGASGLLSLRRAGAVTIAQDEATSTVYGMPQVARRLDAATHVLPLDDIARLIMRSV